jgi:hypothetical protein
MFRGTVLIIFMLFAPGLASAVSLSAETRSCLNCHRALHPGIVKDWESSMHAGTTPAEALGKGPLERRVSAASVDDALGAAVVGCHECHAMNPDAHEDNFPHFGFRINVVVTPRDCAVCHPEEAGQYAGSKKAHAVGNLEGNPVYHTLYSDIIGLKKVDGLDITGSEPSDHTRQEACFACHGTVVRAGGLKSVETKFGALKVPALSNWPNQGVGRINPDGSMGACTSCHPRHAFSIEVARKPFTCAQCHLEPDVPAWNVYAESKHGNIFLSMKSGWDFNSVPWRLGEDFTAPTCAVCHASLITSPGGAVIAPRSHDFGARLWVRLFGLIYTHPQPKNGDTTIIMNRDGLPLPTAFTGERALRYLIGEEEQARRKGVMTALCRGCHNTDWVDSHFMKLETTLRETDGMTLAATRLLLAAWEAGAADKKNPFDEALERKWIKQWLFYGNTARYASAMSGAPDYAAFKYGWWGLTTNLEEMKDKIEMKIKPKDLSAE